MAKLSIAGNVVVVTSTLKIEEIETLAKYQPKSLKLFEPTEDGHRTEVFSVCVGNKGSISKFGACFSGESFANGGASLTIALPAGLEDAVGYVADTYGVAVELLGKVEENAAVALDEVKAKCDALKASIEILA